jgi:sugar fermentation stimulation protein A
VGQRLIFEPCLSRGVLVRRYKRFLADVTTADGELLTMHCPNTGAMTGCSDPGSEVWYSESNRATRKYPHTLEVVCTAQGVVGVHSQLANRLIGEALEGGIIVELTGYDHARGEAPIPDGSGRFDFALTAPGRVPCYVEVKSLTLALPGGVGAFPDAVSSRAVSHAKALQRQVEQGSRAVLVFCVQHTGVRFATPADDVHPEYGVALRAAVEAGVEVLAYSCDIDRRRNVLRTRLPVRL